MDDAERQAWLKAVGPIELGIEGVDTPMYLRPKIFKSGSVGWHLSAKANLSDTPCQLSLCITVIKTKRTDGDAETTSNGKAPEGLEYAQDLREAPEGTATHPEPSKRPRRSPRGGK